MLAVGHADEDSQMIPFVEKRLKSRASLDCVPVSCHTPPSTLCRLIQYEITGSAGESCQQLCGWRSVMRLELNCAECGKDSFNLGRGAEDDSVNRCNFCCHEIGTMADLKQRVAAEVLKLAAERDASEA
jgi:hypothetical protein